VEHHLDDERGFLDAAACVAHIGDRAHADFYVCGPGPYMDVVEAALDIVSVAPEQVFIERFVEPPASAAGSVDASATESVTITLEGKTETLKYQAGDTILEAARRGGLNPPLSRERGTCANLIAHPAEGAANMRANNALTPDEVDTGWVLTCQAVPSTATVVVDYDA